jgi:hypothetical protein
MRALYFLLPFVISSAGVATAQDPLEFFETQVRPLLAEKCFACHTQTKMGGLEMTSRDSLLKGGRSGPAVEPRAPERSLLIRAVSYEDEKLKMPPSEQLTKEEIAVLTKWVDAGAAWPAAEGVQAADSAGFRITDEHRAYWAFRPVKTDLLPPGAGSAIDRFINDKLKDKGLTPAPQADKRTLLRRVYFDLTGLPPTPQEMEAFLADDSPNAYAQVVDRLLASPRYGERWGRHWLDVARYSDDRLNSTEDEPYPNAFRYRDWVIKAFNDDMPYDLFVKAQIAADQLTEQDRKGRSKEELIGGLGLFGLSPNFQDDRVDVVTRGFLAITVACAQCHDHKFDPIPTEDYYSLLGVFNSTKIDEHPLVDGETVEVYRAKKKLADEAKAKLDDFLSMQARQLVDAFAAQTEEYIVAAWRLSGPGRTSAKSVAKKSGLDRETLENWTAYLNGTPKEHKLLDEWHKLLADKAPEEEVRRFGRGIERKLIEVIGEKKRIELENEILLGGDKSGGNLRRTMQLALPREEFYLWNDLASPNGREIPAAAKTGILYYKGEALERFLSGVWLEHVRESRRRTAELEANVPAKYAFEHVISDVEKPRNEHVHIRGNPDNLGAEVPRRFLRILCDEEPEPFTHGSGRLELARAIASPANPLTARVMANRVWLEHFGRGLVGTPSNFGVMGERPTHPELLDYLAARLVESGWSVKTLHREILLTDVYRRSSQHIAANQETDGENKLLWRANRRRLDVEGLRDSLLYVAGRLVETPGGPPRGWATEKEYGRTVYRFVSRRSLDPRLGLFDFPNPNQTSERRVDTNTPLQGLFFYNSELVMEMAEALAARIALEAGDDPRARIERAYRLLFGRTSTSEETSLALGFLDKSGGAWPRLAHVWLSSNEFRYVD